MSALEREEANMGNIRIEILGTVVGVGDPQSENDYGTCVAIEMEGDRSSTEFPVSEEQARTLGALLYRRVRIVIEEEAG